MNNLPKVVSRRKKRVGRGPGSGKGSHTTGRGQKGQGARRTIPILFEGVKVKKSLLHRIPMSRGKAKFKALSKPYTVSTTQLKKVTGNTITVSSLVEAHIVPADAVTKGVKIVTGENPGKKFVVEVPASQTALDLITK